MYLGVLTKHTRHFLLKLRLNSDSLWMLAAWNRTPFKKVSRYSLLLPPGSTKRHSWRLLGFTCEGSSVDHVQWVNFPFPWGKSSELHQVSSRVSQAWFCMWTNNFVIYATLTAAVQNSVDARLMITDEGFSLVSHLEYGWRSESLIILTSSFTHCFC